MPFVLGSAATRMKERAFQMDPSNSAPSGPRYMPFRRRRMNRAFHVKPIAGIFIAFYLFMVGLREDKRRIHDLIAGNQVVRGKG